MITRVAKCHRKTQKHLEVKFTEDDPLTRVEIGPVWIATYGMDEYPLRYVSETTWMNSTYKKGMNFPFSRSWMTTSFRMKAQSKFRMKLSQIHEVHGSM